MYRKPIYKTATIANGGTTSAPVRIGQYAIGGIRTPAALTSATCTFHGCETPGGTYCPLYDSDGNALVVSLGTSRAVSLAGTDADIFAPWPWIKVVMAGAEGAQRDLVLVLK